MRKIFPKKAPGTTIWKAIAFTITPQNRDALLVSICFHDFFPRVQPFEQWSTLL